VLLGAVLLVARTAESTPRPRLHSRGAAAVGVDEPQLSHGGGAASSNSSRRQLQGSSGCCYQGQCGEGMYACGVRGQYCQPCEASGGGGTSSGLDCEYQYPNSHASSDGGCECDYGYELYQNDCVSSSSGGGTTASCGSHATAQGSSCVCNTGYSVNAAGTGCARASGGGGDAGCGYDTCEYAYDNECDESRFGGTGGCAGGTDGTDCGCGSSSSGGGGGGNDGTGRQQQRELVSYDAAEAVSTEKIRVQADALLLPAQLQGKARGGGGGIVVTLDGLPLERVSSALEVSNIAAAANAKAFFAADRGAAAAAEDHQEQSAQRRRRGVFSLDEATGVVEVARTDGGRVAILTHA